MSVTMTALPVLSRISNEIFDRLSTLVGVGEGTYRIPDVVRPTRSQTYTPQHGLVVLTRGEYVRVPELDCPGSPPAIAYQQTFLVRVHIAPSELDNTPVEIYEDIMEAAVIKAIRNSDDWYNFNGDAINAVFQAGQLSTSDGSYDGIAIPVQVMYRIAEDDPYTSRG